MESLHHIFISTAIFIFILILLCAFIFWLIKYWRSKSSYELSTAVIQNKELSQPEFYVWEGSREMRDVLMEISTGWCLNYRKYLKSEPHEKLQLTATEDFRYV